MRPTRSRNAATGLAFALIVVTCSAGWLLSDTASVDDAYRGAVRPAHHAPPARQEPVEPANIRVESAPAEASDAGWMNFRRRDVVVPALATIPRYFAADDCYRDTSLNPRDTRIQADDRRRIAVVVERYMARILAADRSAKVAEAKLARLLAAVDAVELTEGELARTSASAAQRFEMSQAMLGIGPGSGQANVGPAREHVVAAALRRVKAAKLAARRDQLGETPAELVEREPARFRRLSISLRSELFDKLRERCVGLGILRPEESHALERRIAEKIQAPHDLTRAGSGTSPTNRGGFERIRARKASPVGSWGNNGVRH